MPDIDELQEVQHDLRYMDNSSHLLKEEMIMIRNGPSSTLARQPAKQIAGIQQRVQQRPLTSKRPVGSKQQAVNQWGSGYSGVKMESGHQKVNEDLMTVANVGSNLQKATD